MVILLFSCDLLSIFEVHLIYNNGNLRYYLRASVVICFRSLKYIWFITTVGGEKDQSISCDLLSIFEVHLIYNNKSFFKKNAG